MPAKEIKELRQSGKLQEAYDMAKGELDANPNDIWAKRNISWVHHDTLKDNANAGKFPVFIAHLRALRKLQMPEEEKMVFDSVAFQIGKLLFAIQKDEHPDQTMALAIWEEAKNFSFTQPSEAYSFLLKAFHKSFKEVPYYVAFADWWNFKNFRPEDYQKEKMPNGKEVMSVAEQAIIAYCKHLLPTKVATGEVVFDQEKVDAFMPFLDDVIEAHPEYQYPAYFKAKLLLAMGDQEHMLSALLPFAKRKRNDFWVWEVMSEAFPNDEEKQLACYCRALKCKSSEDFLINLRQKLARILISRNLFDEAKTELSLLINARNSHEWKIPTDVQQWTSEKWYQAAKTKKSNSEFYEMYAPLADDLLNADVPEETIIIDFVNSDRSIANFIATEARFGFFNFDCFFKKLDIGDVLSVRFNKESKDGLFHLLTARQITDNAFRQRYMKQVEGSVRIGVGKNFGFIDDVFVHPSLISKHKLTNGSSVKTTVVKSYNASKKQWGWKAVAI